MAGGLMNSTVEYFDIVYVYRYLYSNKEYKHMNICIVKYLYKFRWPCTRWGCLFVMLSVSNFAILKQLKTLDTYKHGPGNGQNTERHDVGNVKQTELETYRKRFTFTHTLLRITCGRRWGKWIMTIHHVFISKL